MTWSLLLGLVKKVETQLASIRESDSFFQRCFEDASHMAEKVGVTITKPRIANRQLLRDSHDIAEVDQYYKVTVFYAFLDHVLNEMKSRFHSESSSCIRMLASLVPSYMTSIAKSDYLEHGSDILQFYYSDLPFPSTMISELERWYNHWNGIEAKPDTATAAIIMCDKDVYPNIYILLKLLVVLPVTTCEVERCNSKLKLVKSSLRSTMSEDRLSSLIMLQINADAELDYTETVNIFAGRKTRKMPLALSKWNM